MNPTLATAIAGAEEALSIPMPMIGKETKSLFSNSSGLYFHVPFCTRKCDYCHFFVLPDKDPFKASYLKAVLQEWKLRLPFLEGKKISTIYFGGGTPSLLGPQAISKILRQVEEDFGINQEVEISLEANPENLSLALLQEYATIGINRLSIGIQSFDDELLRVLGRLHSSQKAIESIFLAKEAGFSNLSIDLMYDIPHQTIRSWKTTLDQIPKLPITHLSLYNLTIEPHTAFFKYRERLQNFLPDEETSLDLYKMAISKLKESGLEQYEISAFCRKGFEARHNSGYWRGIPFFGFGPSAFSYWKGERFRNIAHLKRYEEALNLGVFPVDFSEKLEPRASRRELLAIQLRLLEGVDLELFQEKNGALDQSLVATLLELEQNALLQRMGNHLSLTPQGILFYDTVATEIIE